jgi:recombination protein RecT
MSNQALNKAVNDPQQKKTFPQMLQAYKGHIALALPKHINADRMGRIALTAFRANPKLENCAPESIFAAVIMSSQLGLEVGIMGQAYLVPYKGECQFIPGWQGYVDLVSRSGRASVWTGAVFQGDTFSYRLGTEPQIHHEPCGEDDIRKLMHCYAIGKIKGAEVPIIEVWTRGKIERHRDRYNKVGGQHYSFNNFEMYGRKVPLLQVIKYMPKSVELQQAYELDVAAEQGQQGIDMKSVLEGTWIAPAAPQPAEGGDSNGVSGGASYAGPRDEKAMLDAIAAAKTVAELAATWKLIATNPDGVPVSVEAARNDRKAAIEQQKL